MIQKYYKILHCSEMYYQLKKQNNLPLMQKFITSLALLLCCVFNVQAQQISGKIIDKANGESLPGTAVKSSSFYFQPQN